MLLLGTGPGLAEHREAVEAYARRRDPVVLALNAARPIDTKLIDAHVACHPMRVLTDAERHATIPAPLIVPAAGLPEDSPLHRGSKALHDFGLRVDPDVLEIRATSATLPTSDVFAYAIAVAAAGGASRVLLAGFDGYADGDPRRAEDQVVLNRLAADGATPPLLAITPTAFDLPIASVYGLLD